MSWRQAFHSFDDPAQRKAIEEIVQRLSEMEQGEAENAGGGIIWLPEEKRLVKKDLSAIYDGTGFNEPIDGWDVWQSLTLDVRCSKVLINCFVSLHCDSGGAASTFGEFNLLFPIISNKSSIATPAIASVKGPDYNPPDWAHGVTGMKIGGLNNSYKKFATCAWQGWADVKNDVLKYKIQLNKYLAKSVGSAVDTLEYLESSPLQGGTATLMLCHLGYSINLLAYQ
jgi:hypothetical protein